MKHGGLEWYFFSVMIKRYLIDLLNFRVFVHWTLFHATQSMLFLPYFSVFGNLIYLVNILIYKFATKFICK